MDTASGYNREEHSRITQALEILVDKILLEKGTGGKDRDNKS